RYLDDSNPYAADLDLFGEASVFELLCTARTRDGQDTLAAWLLAPASTGEVRARQQAVRSLRDRLDLREDLELIACDVPPGDERTALAAWAKQPVWPGLEAARGLTGILSGVFVFVIVLWVAAGVAGVLLPFLLALEAGLALALRYRVHQALAPIEPYAR